MTPDRWRALGFEQQLLHIGAELGRLAHGAGRQDTELVRQSAERALELLDLTVATAAGWRPMRFKELLRLREILAGFYLATPPDAAGPRQLFQVLMDFTPATHAIPYE